MSDAGTMLRELAEPWAPGEKVREAIDRLSKAAKLPFWRTSDIWYGKARKIEDEEVEKIREALRIKTERAARNELHELKFRLAKLEARLDAGDADFYRPDIDGLRAQTAHMGGSNSARRR